MAKTKVHGEYLDASVISGQTQVTAVGADSVLIFDATDNALKKALLSDVIETVADGDISTAKIADNAVTSAKLDTNIAIAGTLASTGKITADAGIDIDNINIDGTTINLSSGDLTINAANDLILTATDIRPRTDLFVLNNAANNKNQIVVQSGAVKLFNDGTERIQTTSTGVQLDGILLSNANGTGGTKATLADFTSSGSIRSILLKGAENTANQVFLDVVRDINGTETTLFSIADTKIGIGTTSPQRPLQVGAYGTGNGEIAIGSATDGYGSILFGDSATGTALYQGYLQYNHSSGAMLFATLASERMRITSSGEVLIGVTSSTGMSGAGLETAGSIRANNYITSTDLAGSGFRNVNTTSSGSLTTSTSLRELKENIVTTSLGLDAVKALTPREFDWKDVAEYGTEDIGFIADEVFAVSPKLATYKVGEKTESNLQGVKYEQLTAVLVKAIQEQQTIIDDLKARIETLEG